MASLYQQRSICHLLDGYIDHQSEEDGSGDGYVLSSQEDEEKNYLSTEESED